MQKASGNISRTMPLMGTYPGHRLAVEYTEYFNQLVMAKAFGIAL